MTAAVSGRRQSSVAAITSLSSWNLRHENRAELGCQIGLQPRKAINSLGDDVIV